MPDDSRGTEGYLSSEPTAATAAGRAVTHHFTLVHGTFARGAVWTQSQSALCHALVDALGPNIILTSFNWSGKNGHSARATAGNQLADFIRAESKSYPDAKRFVICHSHGGNVALYAHRALASETTTPTNLITLATPFIRIEPRPKTLLILRLGWLMFLVMVSLIAFLAIALFTGLESLFMRILPSTRAGDLPWPLFDTNIAAAVLLSATVYWPSRNYVKNLSRRLRERLAWPNDGRLNLLTICYRWDEARGFLQALQWGTNAVARGAWYAIGIVLLPFAFYGVLSVFSAYFIQPLYESDFITANIDGKRIPIFLVLNLEIGLLMVLLAFVGTVAYLLTFLRGNPYGFGWERPSTSFFLDIRALDKPDGLRTQSVKHFRIPIGTFAGKKRSLAHSLIYEDPRIHQEIVNWVAGQN